MTPAQAQDYLRSVIDRINGTVAQREAQREAAQAQAAADAMAVMGAALSNYGASVQSAPPPVARPPTFIHCFTTGANTDCY